MVRTLVRLLPVMTELMFFEGDKLGSLSLSRLVKLTLALLLGLRLGL